jgi:hypothetical protein
MLVEPHGQFPGNAVTGHLPSDGSECGLRLGPRSCERHARYQARSLNPRPLKIIGTHLSARAARVFTCFAPAT